MESTTLSQQVYDHVYQKLRTGSLKPATRLVNRTLAAELGVSTIPVREAISRLVSEGLLESSPGGGAYVRTIDANELGELYDVREALEVLAAAEATKFSGESLLFELRAHCDQFQAILQAIPTDKWASRPQFHRWLEIEEQFHIRVVEAARNRWLLRTVRSIRVISQVFAAQRQAPRLLTRGVAEATQKEHLDFVQILERRDIEQAKQWMTAHIRQGRNTVLSFLTNSIG